MKGAKEEAAWLQGVKRKIAEELSQKEMDTISYWKGEMEKILTKRHESFGALQIEIQTFLQRMQNRLRF